LIEKTSVNLFQNENNPHSISDSNHQCYQSFKGLQIDNN